MNRLTPATSTTKHLAVESACYQLRLKFSFTGPLVEGSAKKPATSTWPSLSLLTLSNYQVRLFSPSVSNSALITMSAPEISNGDFLYRDTLFVNFGPSKCHPRASVSELKALLLPKKGSAPKDQVAHWYEAQLIHYGLPRSKDKNTAKVRLTSAISTGLAVPADIARTEADMKKQYASAVRKAHRLLLARRARQFRRARRGKPTGPGQGMAHLRPCRSTSQMEPP